MSPRPNLPPSDPTDSNPADSPFHCLNGLSRAELAATCNLPAAERRLLTKYFVETFQREAIRPLLPLRLIVPPEVPAWQPRRCRSYYRCLPPEGVQSADDFEGLDDFDLVLRLYDFSAWRLTLAPFSAKKVIQPQPSVNLPLHLRLMLVLSRHSYGSGSPTCCGIPWRRRGCHMLETMVYSCQSGGALDESKGYDPY